MLVGMTMQTVINALSNISLVRHGLLPAWLAIQRPNNCTIL